jgi:hypothetical protein
MYVRVVSAPNSQYWYANYIGHLFETASKSITPNSIHYFRDLPYNQENYPKLCDKSHSGQPVLMGGDIIRVELGSEQNNESMTQLLKKGDF